MTSIVERIQTKAQLMNLSESAKTLGINRDTLRKIINCESPLKAKDVRNFADIFGMTIEDILDFSEVKCK